MFYAPSELGDRNVIPGLLALHIADFSTDYSVITFVTVSLSKI